MKTALAIVFVCVQGYAGESAWPERAAYRVCDVLVTRHSDTYRPRTYRALLATDGRCCRIAFYWLNPPEEIEPTDALAFSDFLFDGNEVRYWQRRDAGRTFSSPLTSPSANRAQLPIGKGFEPLLGSILMLTVQNRTPTASQEGMMEARRFFQGIREHGPQKHTAERPPVDAAADAMISRWTKGDATILDQLPFGRTYSRTTDREGSVVWRMAKATVPMERARVTIRPAALHNASGWSEIADPATLGRWSAVPEVYRRYWSLRDRSLNLRRKANIADAEQLHADIASALAGTLPDDVNVPLRELLFHVSLHTGSDEAIRSTAGQYFRAYVRLAQEPVERVVIELGRIGQDLRVAWPQDEIRDFIRPLLGDLVVPQAFADPAFVQHYILRWLQVQGPTWSWYAQLVRETVQDATGMTLEPATRVERGSARPNGSTNIGDLEPNDDAASTNNREQKGLLPHDERE